MGDLDFDMSDFERGTDELVRRIEAQNVKATDVVALKLLQLSQQEVPIYMWENDPQVAIMEAAGVPVEHKTGGHLQNSGTTDRDGEDALVGYNTPYAAYQHEGQMPDGSRIIRHHTSPRGKTKYLEDPLKNNLAVFLEYYGRKMQEVFN